MPVDRILVLGASGRLGSALVQQRWPIGTFVLPATRDQLDLTDADAVWSYLMRWRPQVVINAAAWTDPAAAEADPEGAEAVNHRAVVPLVQGVRAIGARLIHVSSDLVFDGSGEGLRREGDPTEPASVLGRTKRAGELAALELDGTLVLRTSCLFGDTADDPVTAFRRLGRTRDRIEVVDDRLFCPTSAADVARAISVAVGAGLRHAGLFHVASPDGASWPELADEVLRLDRRRDLVDLVTVTAPRSDTRLSSEAFAAAYDHTLPTWRFALASVLDRLDRRSGTAPVDPADPAGIPAHGAAEAGAVEADGVEAGVVEAGTGDVAVRNGARTASR